MGESAPPRQCVIPIHRPDKRELAFFLITGIVVSFPFAFFYETFSLLFVFVSLVILAPFIEELAKVFPLFYRHGETERTYVTLAALIGLGFGISEFVEYVFLFHVFFLYRIPGLVFHPSTAAITGFGLAKKKAGPYYALAVTLHALNNLFAYILLYVNPVFAQAIYFADLLVLIVAYLSGWRCYRQSSQEKMVI